MEEEEEKKRTFPRGYKRMAQDAAAAHAVDICNELREYN